MVYTERIANRNSRVVLTQVGKDAHDSNAYFTSDASTKYDILVYLNDHDGAARVFDIADGVSISESSVIRIVDNMYREGLVTVE